MRFTADGMLAVAESDGGLRLWDPETQRLLGALYPELLGLFPNPRVFSPSGELVATWDCGQQGQRRIRVWPWRRLLGGSGAK